MGATVTNQDLGVVTTTSGHKAETEGATDVCWNPPHKAVAPHENKAPAERAKEKSSTKTKFQDGQVVRLNDGIDPSDPPHGDTGGGVVSGTYRKTARGVKASQDVKVEKKKITRTNDSTTQNNANTTGKMVESAPVATISAIPDDVLDQCSHDTSTIKCQHNEPTTDKEIDVLRGDTITVSSKRKNAKDPGKGPVCTFPPHMEWTVLRKGGLTAFGMKLEQKGPEEFTGDTLVLDGEWTGQVGQLKLENEGPEMTSEGQQFYNQQENTFANNNAIIRGSSTVEAQDRQLAAEQVAARKAEAGKTPANIGTIQEGVTMLSDSAQFVAAWCAQVNPVRLTISGEACSGSVNFTVDCYPAGSYDYSLDLKGLVRAGQWMSRAMTVVRNIGSLANIQVDNEFKCPGSNLSISLGFKWKHGDEPYKIKREAELSLGGTIFTWKFEISVPITNLLAIIPGVGIGVANWANRVIQWVGAECSIGIGVEIGVGVSTAIKFAWTKADGWEFACWNAIVIPIDPFKIYMFGRVKLRDNLLIQGSLEVTAGPAFLLEVSKAGISLKSDDFMIRVGFAGIIMVDIGFYSFDQSGTWYPDSWQCRVPEAELWKILDNKKVNG